MITNGDQCQTISQCTTYVKRLAITRNFSHVYYKNQTKFITRPTNILYDDYILDPIIMEHITIYHFIFSSLTNLETWSTIRIHMKGTHNLNKGANEIDIPSI